MMHMLKQSSIVLFSMTTMTFSGCMASRSASYLDVVNDKNQTAVDLVVTRHTFGFSTEGPELEKWDEGTLYIKSDIRGKVGSYSLGDLPIPYIRLRGKFYHIVSFSMQILDKNKLVLAVHAQGNEYSKETTAIIERFSGSYKITFRAGPASGIDTAVMAEAGQ